MIPAISVRAGRAKMVVPLARRILLHRPRRLMLSVAGIACSTLIVFMEVGFYHSLFDTQTRFINQLNADLFITSAIKEDMIDMVPFPRDRLYQAKRAPGVRSIHPLYMHGRTPFKDPSTGVVHPIRVFGSVPDSKLFRSLPANVATSLRVVDRAFFDDAARRFFKDPKIGSWIELRGRRIELAGNFHLGSDFVNDGNVLVSDETFFRIFPTDRPGGISPSDVEFGLVRLEPGADPEQVRRSLLSLLPADVTVRDAEGLKKAEWQFWTAKTPVGFVFGMGTVVGLLIGTIVIYQILFTEVSELLPQFATLKAIGYANADLRRIVMEQTAMLTVLGFVLGTFGAEVLYESLRIETGLIIALTPVRVLQVAALTMAISFAAALVAMRRLEAADPAEVFGQ